MFIGVLRYYKGLDVLINAAKNTSIKIIIAGTGPLELNLKKQARKLGMRNIYFIGKINDEEKVALLNLCYGFVFPSNIRTEAFGISLLEAASPAPNEMLRKC